MGKPALVVRRTEYTVSPRNPKHWNLMLADRDNCEKDYTLLQLLPYVVFIDHDKKKVFTYVRGKAGNESALHLKLSIGLGGHMDELPGDRSLAELVLTEALREIDEEIGIKFDDPEVIRNLLENIQESLRNTFVLETSNPVDLKHLCIPIIMFINSEDIEASIKAEEKVIEEPRFMSFEDALAIAGGQTPGMEFEFWSSHILMQQ